MTRMAAFIRGCPQLFSSAFIGGRGSLPAVLAAAEGLVERVGGATERVVDRGEGVADLAAVVAGGVDIVVAERAPAGAVAAREVAVDDSRVLAARHPPLQLGRAHGVEGVVAECRVDRLEYGVPSVAAGLVLRGLREELVEVDLVVTP